MHEYAQRTCFHDQAHGHLDLHLLLELQHVGLPLGDLIVDEVGQLLHVLPQQLVPHEPGGRPARNGPHRRSGRRGRGKGQFGVGVTLLDLLLTVASVATMSFVRVPIQRLRILQLESHLPRPLQLPHLAPCVADAEVVAEGALEEDNTRPVWKCV